MKLKIYLFLTLGLLIFLNACEVDSNQNLERRSYQTVIWNDEFDGAAGELPNSENWTFDIGQGENGWGNQEFQYYTDDRRNVAQDGQGNLLITARNETFGGANFTSARIKTLGLFDQTYGRFEARIKTPFGPGIWPAFWLLGSNCDEEPWPQCGEIDILELRGQEPHIMYGSVHGPGYSGGNSISGSFGLVDDRFDNEFHLYSVEWGEDFIEFFVDDFMYKRVTPEDLPGEWVFDHDFHIILNVAVGGTFVGFPTSQTPFPQTMTVDYVRVYN